MADLDTVISLLNLVGLGGVGVFLYYLIRGLRERIATLTELTQEQKKTLEAVRGRAEEMDRLSESYKRALIDFEEMGKKIEERRRELIKELEDANQRKDEQLAKLTSLQLEELELQKKSLERLPELEYKLAEAVHDLESQLRIVAPSRLDSDLETPKVESVWAEIARVAAYSEVLYPHYIQGRPALRGFKPRSEWGSKKEAGEAEEIEK